MTEQSNPADIYVVMLTDDQPSDGYDRGWLLCLEPMTLADALAAMRWQLQGVSHGVTPPRMILAKPSEDLPAVMEHTRVGQHSLRPVLLDRFPYTTEAWRNALLTIWGKTE